MKYVYGKRIKTLKDRLTTGIAALALLANTAGMSLPFLLTQKVAAATSYSQGFEANTDGWISNGGSIVQTASGSPVSATGSNHATVDGSVYTNWGGYENNFPVNGYTTQVDIFLDTTVADGTLKRIDFSSAINDAAGAHLRDFVTHIGTVDGSAQTFSIGASNNAESVIGLADGHVKPGKQFATITDSGWYTFSQRFFNDAGNLSVEFTVTKLGGSEIGTKTIASTDPITNVGGHRYGWFIPTTAPLLSPLHIDNAILTTAPIEPEITYAVAGLHDAANYQGVSVNVGVENATDVTEIKVAITRADGSVVTKTSRPGATFINNLNSGASDEFTTPIVINHGTYSEEHSSSWFPAPALWDDTTTPTSMTVTIVRSGGSDLVATAPITGQGTYLGILPAFACSLDNTTFDTFSTGSVNNQHGWSATGPYDQAIVDNTYGFSEFGCKSLRISDADTSGSFGDWVFAPQEASTAGESSVADVDHYEVKFDIASTSPTEQPGLSVSVSPDDGNGSRMSYLRFDDTADGIDVFFYDAFNPGPHGTVSNFVETKIADNLSRTQSHSVKLTIDFVDGSGNDVVKVYIDGNLVHTGTSWEDYYRYDSEQSGNGNTLPAVDTLILQARGAEHPANAGNGFLFDNLSVTTADTEAPATPTGLHRVAKDDGEVMACSVVTQRQVLYPTWDENTEDDFSHYEYTSYNPGGVVGINEQVVNTNQFVHNWTPPADGTNGYKVRAVDTAGNKSDWTDICYVTYDSTAPDAFLVSPADNSVVNGASVTQEWGSNASDVAYFVYESYHDAGATSLRWHEEVAGTSKTATNVANATYWWRVKAVDHAGNESSWSPLWKLTIDNTAPAKPQVLGVYKDNDKSQPIIPCGGYTNSTKILIDWEDNSDGDIAYYWFGTKFNSHHKKVTASEYKGNMTPGNNPYYYTVIAVDHAGNESEISEQCELTLDQEAPGKPGVSIWQNGSDVTNGTVSDRTINVKWTAPSTDVDYYEYQAAGSGSWTQANPWETTVNGTNRSGDINGADGDRYYRVRAVDNAGNKGQWSDWVKVTLDTSGPDLVADYFSVHPDHLGVGFSIDGFDDATSVDVAIYDADDNLITRNTGDSALMTALLNSHTGQISSPFYIPFGDTTDGYWTFGNADWADVIPAYAVITINYGSGDSTEDRVDFTSTNPDTNISYNDLLAGTSLGACTGQSVDCGNNSNNTDGTDRNIIKNLTSGGNGSVLGASTDGLTNTGSQNGGIVVLAAASLMAIALVVLRRKQEN